MESCFASTLRPLSRALSRLSLLASATGALAGILSPGTAHAQQQYDLKTYYNAHPTLPYTIRYYTDASGNGFVQASFPVPNINDQVTWTVTPITGTIGFFGVTDTAIIPGIPGPSLIQWLNPPVIGWNAEVSCLPPTGIVTQIPGIITLTAALGQQFPGPSGSVYDGVPFLFTANQNINGTENQLLQSLFGAYGPNISLTSITPTPQHGYVPEVQLSQCFPSVTATTSGTPIVTASFQANDTSFLGSFSPAYYGGDDVSGRHQYFINVISQRAGAGEDTVSRKSCQYNLTGMPNGYYVFYLTQDYGLPTQTILTSHVVSLPLPIGGF